MQVKPALATLIAMALCHIALADRILDSSFFDNRTHNLLDFNTRGDGDPSDPGKGGSAGIREPEYTNQGLSKVRYSLWVHDNSDEFTEHFDEVASAPVYVYITDSGSFDPSLFEFSPGVRYFGLWILHNTHVPRPQIRAYDKNGKYFETAYFDDDAVDGTWDIPGAGEVEYGFLGISADRDISRIDFPKGASIDDLYYAPEPATSLILFAGAAPLIRRRR